MSDPAVEAARRANDDVDGYWSTTRDAMEAAAREALKPIREKCEELDAMFGDAASDVAAGVRLVLTQIASLIYASKEVDR